ncbi:MAG: flagellar basal body L-ring protein FlgH [Phycisphaerae bacterium]|jgi:flagellar L-ring protein precursor FlgH|nr:flagellar basal body L-ring protein FlgH [Phycisphaerae bacterium]
MNNRIIFSFILIFFVFCAVDRSQANSIWSKRDQNKKDLYADDKARHIGDVLTITISEASKVDNKQNRNLSKETARSANFDGQLGIVSSTAAGATTKNYLPRMPGINLTAESSNTMDSKADYKDERKFIDSITVVVVDIMPNNNLVVMGTRSREIAGDKQVIQVSGIVRPSDIAYNNTIKSEQIANFSIITRNTGIAADFSKPGWLGRIFDVFWPF